MGSDLNLSAQLDVEIRGLILDPVSNTPIVILKKPDENLFLPIWIGVFEANAIALQIENVQTPRPMTHDLLKTVIDDLDYTLERVTIADLRENTFYAVLTLVQGEEIIEIDARPSDSLALALRCDANIFVAEEVLAATEIREDIVRFEQLMAQVDLPENEDRPLPPEEPGDEPGEAGGPREV